MKLVVKHNVIENPKQYVSDIHKLWFLDIKYGDQIFKGIQPRDSDDDEFAEVCLRLFPNTIINYNFVRQSPYKQEEPNFIHSDEMMGDITCILYLNESPPVNDGTIFYNNNNEVSVEVKAEFNKMIAFDSEVKHSRAIFDNYGMGRDSRLIQVIFLGRL